MLFGTKRNATCLSVVELYYFLYLFVFELQNCKIFYYHLQYNKIEELSKVVDLIGKRITVQ